MTNGETREAAERMESRKSGKKPGKRRRLWWILGAVSLFLALVIGVLLYLDACHQEEPYRMEFGDFDYIARLRDAAEEGNDAVRALTQLYRADAVYGDGGVSSLRTAKRVKALLEELEPVNIPVFVGKGDKVTRLDRQGNDESKSLNMEFSLFVPGIVVSAWVNYGENRDLEDPINKENFTINHWGNALVSTETFDGVPLYIFERSVAPDTSEFAEGGAEPVPYRDWTLVFITENSDITVTLHHQISTLPLSEETVREVLGRLRITTFAEELDKH